MLWAQCGQTRQQLSVYWDKQANTHMCARVLGVSYIYHFHMYVYFSFAVVVVVVVCICIQWMKCCFFFLVLSYSLFYSVPRLFHNAGMAGFCNPFWNIVDVLYSYIYHIYIIYYCCFMQIKFSSVFYNLKFFFWLAANCRQMLHLTHCRDILYI